jgi:hypothetical protein
MLCAWRTRRSVGIAVLDAWQSNIDAVVSSNVLHVEVIDGVI